MADDLHYLGLVEVSERIRRRELSSEEVTRALIARIERLDARLNCVLHLMAESALVDAKRADAEVKAGFWRGPLHGVPIGIKDLIWTKDAPTTGGMAILKDFHPDEDATVVRRLRQAGAVILAKLHTTEGATLDHHLAFGRPTNPWSAAHWTGASSSGSGVAVAAGLCYAAIGTDTAGSIRTPSAANSVTALKPSWGRVSRHGLIPLAETLDHIGPMARNAEDVAAVLQSIAGADLLDPTALAEPVPDYGVELGRRVDDLVIGIDPDLIAKDVTEEVEAAVRGAIATFTELGARVRTVTFPSLEADLADIMAAMQAETVLAHADHFPAKAEGYGRRLRQQLEGSDHIDTMAVARGHQARERFSGRVQSLFRDVDLVLTPVMGGLVPTWDAIDSIGDAAGDRAADFVRYTFPHNMARTPAIALPAGFSSGGLPIGLQLAAWRLREPMLLRAAVAFQRATDFHSHRPPLEVQAR